MMTKMAEGNIKNWDQELNRVLWEYKIAVKANTQFSPHVVYEKEAILPLDVEILALKLLVDEGQESMDNYRMRLLTLQTDQSDIELAFEHYERVQAQRQTQKGNCNRQAY